MKVNITDKEAQQVLVALTGELDTAATEELAKELDPLMQCEAVQMTVDFSELEYISSAGMRIMLLLNKTVTAKGGSLTITGMNADIRQLFTLTGFDQMITIA